MKTVRLLIAILCVALVPTGVKAQTTDSVDVLDYDITLDLSTNIPFHGTAVITMQLLRPCDAIGLDLIGIVDSLFVNDIRMEPADMETIPTAGIAAGQEFNVRVHYLVNGYVETSGWGGLHEESDMTYNLGVGFGTNPHVIGRAVFPCRDNFTDKATYTLRITARETWSAECSGVLQSRTMVDGAEHSVWRIDQPVCTYLVGISQAPYRRLQTTAGGYPVTIGYTAAQDSATVSHVFALLDDVVPMYERCFGPYRWERIGYIPTSRGSMEHVQNIALAYQAMASVTAAGQSTIAHELAHAWFGNLVTCADEGDMWINEGGASFCSEVAREATHGRASATATYQQNLESVVRTAHISDGSMLPLHGMPHNHTYGTTTYDKGALVWHSLRGHLGDSLFYAAMRRLFSSCAFGNLDAQSLRNSLESYTGVSLDDFFRFHVFNAGFADYHISLQRGDTPTHVCIRLRHQGVGTDSLQHTARVPVIFIAYDGSQYKHVLDVEFDEYSMASQWVSLPFEPAYCVLDLDCEISDAATVDHLVVGSDGNYSADVVHAAFRAHDIAQPYDFHVTHHYGHPYGLDTMAGVVRTADRYWVVEGNAWVAEGLEGRFRYVRRGNTSSTYAHLDDNFYRRTASLDSIVLMWRPNDSTAWRALTRRHTSNRDEGFFILSNLRRGEYTLAVVDSNIVGIDTPTLPTRMGLFPNPVGRGEEFGLDVPCDEPFDVTIFDAAGRQVWHQRACHNGQKVRLGLASGTYLVRIENNFISLQSNLIQL